MLLKKNNNWILIHLLHSVLEVLILLSVGTMNIDIQANNQLAYLLYIYIFFKSKIKVIKQWYFKQKIIHSTASIFLHKNKEKEYKMKFRYYHCQTD